MITGVENSGEGIKSINCVPEVPQGSFLWITTATASATQLIDLVDSAEFSTPVITSASGLDGLNQHIVELYQVSNNNETAPSDPTGMFTYTFSTDTLAANAGANLNGWTQDIPEVTQGTFLWVIQATASSREDTDIIAGTEFSAATVISSSGAATAVVPLYIVTTSDDTSLANIPPPSPTGNFVYSFTNHTLTGADASANFNSWSQTLPNVPSGSFLWIIQAVASSVTNTDTIAGSEFSAPVITSSAGLDGNAVAIVELYQTTTSNTTAPDDPTGTFTYTYATNLLSGGNLNGWSQSVPTVPQGSYLWLIQAAAVSRGATDTIAASEFSSAVVVSSAGADGNDGAAGYTFVSQALTHDQIGNIGTTQIRLFFNNVAPSDTSVVNPNTISGIAFNTGGITNTDYNGFQEGDRIELTRTLSDVQETILVSVNSVNVVGTQVTISVDFVSTSFTGNVRIAEPGSTFTLSWTPRGATGNGLQIIYINSETFPATPAPSEDAPTGWSFANTAPTGNESTYISTGIRANNVGAYTWSLPTLASGATGTRGAGRWNVRVGPTLAASYTQAELLTLRKHSVQPECMKLLV